MKQTTRTALALIFALFVFVADQLSKWAVTQHIIRPHLNMSGEAPCFLKWLSLVEGHLPFTSIEVFPFFNIVMVWNKGVSFGLFNDSGDLGTIVMLILSLGISVFFLLWIFKAESKLQLISLALLLGGALGNIADRARFGAVIDFLDFHVMGMHWPAFNVADSCVVIGVFLLMIHVFFFDTPKKDARVMP